MILNGFFEENDYDLISISDTNKEKREMCKLWLENKKDGNAAIFLNFYDIEGIESGLQRTRQNKLDNLFKRPLKERRTLLFIVWLV